MEDIRQGDIPGVQLRRRLVISSRQPQEVWPFLAQPELLASWAASSLRSDPDAPDKTVLERYTGESLIIEEVEVLSAEEPTTLVMGLRQIDGAGNPATIVTLGLTQVDAGCEVMVFQEGFQQLPLSSCMTAWELARVRWTEALERLAEAASPPV